jgi:hypothetical protein
VEVCRVGSLRLERNKGAGERRPWNPDFSSGDPALTHHGTSKAQREINRGVLLEDEIDAAFAHGPLALRLPCRIASREPCGRESPQKLRAVDRSQPA